jgi:hypothetical protein
MDTGWMVPAIAVHRSGSPRGAFNSPFTMNGSPSMKPVPGKRCFGDRS